MNESEPAENIKQLIKNITINFWITLFFPQQLQIQLGFLNFFDYFIKK